MKTLTLILSLGLFFVLAQNAAAQSRKLMVFRKNVAVAGGTLKGAETKTFYFKVKKDTDIDISIDEAEKRAKFLLYKPDGKPFYDDGSANQGDIFDLLDILPDAGIYKLVVQLPENLQKENAPVKFTVRLILK
jgi:hypothetical protein